VQEDRADPLREVHDEQQGIFSIQGKRANRLEVRVYEALLRAGYGATQIQFQVGLLGGRHFRGGVVVDFVVDTKPLPTIIYVNSRYWHSGELAADDWIDKRRLIDELGMWFNPPVDLWGNELQTDDMAYDAVLWKVGLP